MANTREDSLARSLDMIRNGRVVSLESAAREVGLTKAGLMHHFPTKEALMLAIVRTVADEWWHSLRSRLGAPPEESPVRDRVAAYLEEGVMKGNDPAGAVIFNDPRLRRELTTAWTKHTEPWFTGIEEMSVEDRGTLNAVRLMADGLWFAKATGVNPPADDERRIILNVAQDLLERVPL